ncbi:type II toxin-antitoxin system TacA family antitoxin [Xanthobacter autotrophicus]|uniref:type II toxin-antitoxin system TacA family antitoxin n=1 Tax=Xanthobacter autotrophicus TaxID=280 RepID=UPI003727EC0E
MAPKPSHEPQTRAVNLRVREDLRGLIDRAARAQGKTRSDFMIDAARRAAEDALLDQTLVRVDDDSYRHFLAVLDQPPGGEGFARLMKAPKPWQP